MAKTHYPLTREGAIYLLTVALLAVAALNTGNNLLFMILAILLAGLVTAVIASGILLRGLEAELQVPEHIFARQPASVRLRIRNHKRRLPSYSLSVGAPAGRPRIWHGSPPNSRSFLRTPVYVPYVPRHGTIAETVRVSFPCRGEYSQGTLELSSKFPFGIIRRKKPLPASFRILVLPSLEGAPELGGLAGGLCGEAGQARRGQSGDFYGLRNYQPGDPARHVDWRSTARTGAVQVREFARDEESRVTLIFDPACADPELPEQFEKAVSLCARVAWNCFEARGWLEFITPEREIAMAPAADVIYPVLEALAVIVPQRPPRGERARVLLALCRSARGFPVIFRDGRVAVLPRGFTTEACVIQLDAL